MEGNAALELAAATEEEPRAGLEPPRRLSWGLRALGIDSLWRQGLTGARIRAGHLDTGVAGDHPALAGRIAAFLEVDDDGRQSSVKAPRDTASHGTHTAGILCGGTAGGEAIGVAPEARLHSAAVIDGGRNVVRILRGMDWLRGSGVRVLSLSLGIPGKNPVFWTMLQVLRAEGVLTVCPIGNHGSAESHAPANYPGVLSVGAVDMDLKLASYTGCDIVDGACRKPEVLAPGVFIRSAHPELGAAARSGTSQASAFVAALACLLFQACPEATPRQVAGALIRSAVPIDPRSGRRYRFGLIQPQHALDLLTEGSDEPAPSDPASCDPPFYRDPELIDQCRCSPPGAQWQGVVIASSHAPADPERGPAGPVVDRIAREIGEPAGCTEYLPAARIAIVAASARFFEALSRDPDVVVLSAATAHNRRAFGDFLR